MILCYRLHGPKRILLLGQIAIWLFANFIGCQPSKQTPLSRLREAIHEAVSDKQAVVGVSIIGNDGKDTLSLNGDRPLPMQSVFKVHVALAILAEVDKGNFALNQQIVLTKDDLLPDSIYSPLRDAYPNGGMFTLAELITYSVSQSDNTACDVLIKLLGSPKQVEAYIKQHGIADIQIRFNERDMQARWENMYENWTTPKASSAVLKLFYENPGLLSPASHDFFWTTALETESGLNRIKGLLPQGTPVAHKTGWSGVHRKTGVTGAANDVGLVFLPDGNYFIISVFVIDSREDTKTNERIIATVAKAAYDYFSGAL